MRARYFPPAVLVTLTFLLAAPASGQNLAFSLFERYADSLRQSSGIPGLSAAIVQDGRVVWERGFGVKDIDRQLPATPATPYPIFDLTQALSAAALMQCRDAGMLSVEDTVRRWIPGLPPPGPSVSALLAHAERGRFQYAPERFGLLTRVLEGCTALPIRAAVAERVFHPAGMLDSVMGRDLAGTADGATLARYQAVLGRLATSYRVDRSGRAIRTDGPRTVDAATGAVSTVRDLAAFDAALDAGRLARVQSVSLAQHAVVAAEGQGPTGLGWFVQDVGGERLVWHFGLSPDAGSSLIVKVPERGLTLILLANSDGLGPRSIHETGDVTQSVFVRIFLRLFV